MDALEFIRVRELDVAVRIWNPKATRTLIAWHGLARHGGDFAALARELGSEWRIIAPDTPGRGLSSWSLFPAHDYLYSHYITIAVALLDHYELDQVDWLGTSMGGLLGMLIAADTQHRSRISRLILNDVGPELNKEGLIALSSYFGVTHRFNNFADLKAELTKHYASFGISREEEWLDLPLRPAHWRTVYPRHTQRHLGRLGQHSLPADGDSRRDIDPIGCRDATQDGRGPAYLDDLDRHRMRPRSDAQHARTGHAHTPLPRRACTHTSRTCRHRCAHPIDLADETVAALVSSLKAAVRWSIR